jgi:hypothetical protein
MARIDSCTNQQEQQFQTLPSFWQAQAACECSIAKEFGLTFVCNKVQVRKKATLWDHCRCQKLNLGSVTGCRAFEVQIIRSMSDSCTNQQEQQFQTLPSFWQAHLRQDAFLAQEGR